jgi:hypothetical protein
MDFDLGIVVPLYNKEATAARAVAALLEQTVPPAQVVVVNDGSTDRSVESLAPLAGRITLRHQPNAGPGAARNTGIAQLGTTWVAFADADNVWHPRRVEMLRDFVHRHPDVDWLAGQYQACLADGRQEVRPPWRGDHAVLPYFEQVLGWTGLHCSETLVARRSLLEDTGGFHKRLRCYEITLLFLQLALRRPHLGFLARPSADVYLDTPGSLFQTRGQHVDALLAYVEELLILARRHAPAPAFIHRLISETLEEGLYSARCRGDHEMQRCIVREYAPWLRRRVRWKARLRWGFARLGC